MYIAYRKSYSFKTKGLGTFQKTKLIPQLSTRWFKWCEQHWCSLKAGLMLDHFSLVMRQQWQTCWVWDIL